MRRDDALAILSAHRRELDRFHVKSLSLFGSVARDEAGAGSDIDVLVEFAEPVHLFEFIEPKQHLEVLLGCGVDLGTPRSLREHARESAALDLVHVT